MENAPDQNADQNPEEFYRSPTTTPEADPWALALEDIKLGDVAEMWFKAPDGLDLQGWLIKPAEFEPGNKYPLILYIHGGPYSMYSVRFNWAWQNFAANGYAVIYMNPRGSTGYGVAYRRALDGRWGDLDVDDCEDGARHLVAQGLADPARVSVPPQMAAEYADHVG